MMPSQGSHMFVRCFRRTMWARGAVSQKQDWMEECPKPLVWELPFSCWTHVRVEFCGLGLLLSSLVPAMWEFPLHEAKFIDPVGSQLLMAGETRIISADFSSIFHYPSLWKAEFFFFGFIQIIWFVEIPSGVERVSLLSEDWWVVIIVGGMVLSGVQCVLSLLAASLWMGTQCGWSPLPSSGKDVFHDFHYSHPCQICHL